MLLTDELRELCHAALQGAGFVGLKGELVRRGWDSEKCHSQVRAVDELVPSQQPIIDLKDSLKISAPDLVANGMLERFLLLNSALRILGELGEMPVAESVKILYRDEMSFFARPQPKHLGLFEAGQYRFAEMCKIASLRRFPAGQLHWELSGVVRRALLQLPFKEKSKVLSFVVRKLGGFLPCFAGHLNGRRKNRSMLLESAQNAAYYRMARSMELQPNIRGYVATSWLYSNATRDASPHLAWLTSVFLENGGLVVDLGPETPDCGALVGSEQRRLLFEKGEFKPRKAMVIWPRREMIRWAEAHTELADCVSKGSTSSTSLEQIQAFA